MSTLDPFALAPVVARTRTRTRTQPAVLALDLQRLSCAPPAPNRLEYEYEYPPAQLKRGGNVLAASPAPHSHPIFRPRFCSSSHFCSGWKYSTMARVLRSSPVASRSTLRQSRVPPVESMDLRNSPT